MGDSASADLARCGKSFIVRNANFEPMTFRTYLVLYLIAIIPPVIIAGFQPAPGYLDSDYYFAGGIQLATGKGFTEPYLWNYLDGTTSLPHPSHSYWMPLASIVAAVGMYLTGETTYVSGRLFFIIIAAFASPITAALAYKFSQQRGLAVTSGLLAIFSVYHAPFVGVTDNFGLFIVFGGVYFILVTRLMEDPRRKWTWLWLGLMAGLLSLARSDGLLWLGLTILYAFWRGRTGYEDAAKRRHSRYDFSGLLRNSLMALIGFLIIMSPWYARNLSNFGTLMAPGGSRALWLDQYDQTFIYPPSLLTMKSFLGLGWREILSDRFSAFGINLQSGFAAHGGILLFPFILAGVFYYRKDDRVKLAGLAWLILIFVMTVLFPFAGARGAFFHAGAALQPMWWTLAPLGLESILVSLRKRGWGNDQNRVIFRSILVMITMILTVFVVYIRLFALGWGEGEEKYRGVEQFLEDDGIGQGDVVIVRNAPGYYLETGRSAVSIPYGGEATILSVSKQFGARYLVVEPEAALQPIRSLFEDPAGHARFTYLGQLDEIRIYRIENE